MCNTYFLATFDGLCTAGLLPGAVFAVNSRVYIEGTAEFAYNSAEFFGGEECHKFMVNSVRHFAADTGNRWAYQQLGVWARYGTVLGLTRRAAGYNTPDVVMTFMTIQLLGGHR